MGNVSIDLAELSGLTPGVDNLKDAVVWFYPFRPYGAPQLVTTDKLVVDTVDGVGSTFLPETPAGNGVYVEIRRVRLPESSRKFIVAIPAGDVNLFDLPHLDPTTLDPDAPLDPAWVAALEAAVPSTGTTGYVLTKGAGGTNAWSAGGGGGGAVSSVNTKTGAVVLNPDDLDDTSTAHKFVTAAERTKLGNTSGTNTGDQDLSGLVPNTRTVAGHALSSNVTVSKGDVGLGSVDNTADSAKPVSTLQAAADTAIGTAAATDATTKVATETTRATTAEALLAPKASPTFTGTVSGITKSMVGLGNVDNTADTAKPVSTAQATADTAIGTAAATDATTKANAAQAAAIAASQPLDSDLTTIAGLTATTNNMLMSVASAWASRTPAQVKAALAIANTDVSGLGTLATQSGTFSGTSSGTNTGDQTTVTGNAGTATKLATARNINGVAFDGSADITVADSTKQPLDSDLTTIAALTATTDNVIQSVAGSWASRTMAQLKTALALVKGDVGLGNVDNTADASKPVSTLQAAADAAVLAAAQPLDSDLTTIAGLTATTGNTIMSTGSAWASRTPAQVKTALAIANTDVSGLGTASTVNTGTSSGNIPLLSTGGVLPIARLATGTPDGTKFVRDDGTLVTPSGGSSSALTRASGQYVRSGAFVGFSGNTTITMGAGNGYYAPMRIGKGGTVTTVKINVTTLAASSSIYLALYSHDATTSLPSALITNFGPVSSTTTGLKSITISQVLADETVYWVYVGPVGGAPAVSAIGSLPDPLLFANANANAYIAGMLDWGSGGLTGPPTTPDARPAAGSIGTFPAVIFGA